MKLKTSEKQKITSAKTSIRKISSVYKNYEFPKGSFILDWGSGKYYSDTIKFMSDKGIIAAGYDPFNQTEEVNNLSLSLFKNTYPDYIVCSNVLNVIESNDIIMEILNNINRYVGENTKLIFSIYQRNKSGIGEVTTKGFQRNQKTKEYIPLISEFFNVDYIKGDFVECSKIA